ncbi:8072_t:CDS:2 [Acaulospora morrowiae]|uniref:8072_t:CDS:1 n=1 Tax=Acaulospora morrowiae TaxID=94023 RepID=A0A9N8WG48_9GLOM|nr:8072_t:CDS:2 [Acaulospora morrowiae]
MAFLDSDYVSEAGLRNLKFYKYAAVDKSPISNYILRPYWNWAIELFPLWMAFPAGLWLYSTFDNVDGKQARRTGTSSPLGELFDHGCDALDCSFGTIVLAGSLGLGHSGYAAVLLLLTTIPFYLSTWEEYHTGVLYLGYFNGPTEGVIIGCILMTISAITGPSIWLKDMRVLSNNVPEFIPEVCKRTKKSFISTLSQLSSITIYSLCAYLWLSSPNSYVLRDKHFILYALTVGIVFGRVATKIILAHVTDMPFPMYTVLLIPLFVGAVLTNIPRFFHTEEILTATGEHYYLWAYFFFAVISYLHWANLVINRFCAHLKIECFHIPTRSSAYLRTLSSLNIMKRKRLSYKNNRFTNNGGTTLAQRSTTYKIELSQL